MSSPIVHYQPVIAHAANAVRMNAATLALFVIVFVAAIAVTRRRSSYGVAALVLSQPFLLSRYVGDTTITLPKVVLLGVLVGLGAQPEWRALLRTRAVRSILIAVLVYTGVVGLTIVVSSHRSPAIRETLKWFEYALLFWTVCVAVVRDRNDALLARVWAATAIGVAVLALAQSVVGAPSGIEINGVAVPRITGPLDGPNQLAAYLGIALCVLCTSCGQTRLVPVAIALSLWALGLTFSRGGAVEAAIGVGVVLAVDAASRRRLAAPIAAGIALAAASASAWIGVAHVRGILPKLPTTFYAGGVGYRGELWRAAIALWREHPVLGVGAGNYELELRNAGVAGVRTHANSWYLQSLAEGGVLLFAATAALVMTLLASLGARLRDAPPWRLAAFAASLAVVVHQIADYLVFYPKVGGTWWILIALGAASSTPTNARYR